MNKTILILLLILKFTPYSYSQNSEVNGVAINHSETGIPFAVVINKTTRKGILCDSLGRFKIGAKIGDTLSGSSVGYLTKNYLLKSLSDQFRLILSTKVDTLKEISVIAEQNIVKHRIGIQKGTRITKNSYFLPTDSFIHAVCFDGQEVRSKRISTLNIKMGYKGNSKYLPVRINLYTQSEKGFPYSKLGSKNIIVNVTKYKWYKIVFDDEFTIPDNGICIGFEPLNPSTDKIKFSRDNTPVLGVYKSEEYRSFSLTNYVKWFKFNTGQVTCPAIYIEIY